MNHSTMAARQDSCISHEGAEEGWHIHYDRMVTQQVFPLTKEGGLYNRSKPGQSCYGVNRGVPSQGTGR